MNNAITEQPNQYSFGESFNYATWPKDTSLTLTNVNWNSDYRDVIRFTNRAALDSWIDAQTGNLNINHMSQKRFQTMRVRINTPIDDAMQFNYLRAVNPLNPVPGASKLRSYYYFIIDYAMISGNTTELTLQLDVWQTFIYDVTLGTCYVERGHIGIANSNATVDSGGNYGRDYLNIPEGLDVGGEYRIVKTASEDVMTIDNYSVLMVSAVDITKDPGNVKDPRLSTATGSTVDGIVSAASFYVFPTPGDFQRFLVQYQTIPWVTQGILSVTVIPPISRYHNDTLTDVAPTIFTPLPPGVSGPPSATPPDYVVYEYPSSVSAPRNTALAANWRSSFLNVLPAAFRGLKKFLTYPYSVIEITTWTGQPLIARPESWADDDATIRELAVMLPPGQRIAFAPLRYNADPSTTAGSTDDNAESLDFATTLSAFPSVPLINNMAIGYLAANKNGLAFQFRSADWSQQRALMGADTTAAVANAEIRNTGRQTIASIAASGAQAQLDQETANNLGVTSALLGTVGIGASGSSGTEGSSGGVLGSLNPMGLAGYDVQQGIKGNAISAGTAIQQQAIGARGQSAIQAGGEVRDANVSLARRAARGDYQNAVAGVNAKIQDARLNQPSTSGQFGGDAMNIAHNKMEVSIRWKLLDPSAVKRIGNYWLRYGYAVQQYLTNIPSDFMCMTKFTYWKMTDTYISQARIPEFYRNGIRGIFEKGVTVWANPSDIGNIALSDNAPKNGISY